jgi:hypothetical protein
MRNLIVRTSLVLFGLLLFVFAFLAAKSGLVEHARLKRLAIEGRQVVGTIIRIDIDKQHPLNATGGEDRTRWEYFRMATVKYNFNGHSYISDIRHLLSGRYENGQIGDQYPLSVLPDQPEKSYGPDLVSGSEFAVWASPTMLLLGTILCCFGGFYGPIWKKGR